MQVGKQYYIISRLNGLALSANCLNEGSALYMKQLQVAYKEQQWTLTKEGTITVGIDGYCIDIKEANRNPGGILILYKPNGGSNQKWEIKDGMVISKHASTLFQTMVLDIAYENPKYNATVITWTMHREFAMNQLWDFVPIDQVTKDTVDVSNIMCQKMRTISGEDRMISIEFESKYDLDHPKFYLRNGKVDHVGFVGKGKLVCAAKIYQIDRDDVMHGVATFSKGSETIHIMFLVGKGSERTMSVGFNLTKTDNDLYVHLVNSANPTVKSYLRDISVSGYISKGTKVLCKVMVQ